MGTTEVKVHSVWFTGGVQIQGRTVNSVSIADKTTSKSVKLGLTDHGVWIQDGALEIIVPYFQVKQVFLTDPGRKA